MLEYIKAEQSCFTDHYKKSDLKCKKSSVKIVFVGADVLNSAQKIRLFEDIKKNPTKRLDGS